MGAGIEGCVDFSRFVGRGQHADALTVFEVFFQNFCLGAHFRISFGIFAALGHSA
jgi:hypothetical protein